MATIFDLFLFYVLLLLGIKTSFGCFIYWLITVSTLQTVAAVVLFTWLSYFITPRGLLFIPHQMTVLLV